MPKRLFGLLAILACPLAQGRSLTPAWVELGENGRAIVRIVIDDAKDCPSVRINGSLHRMAQRGTPPEGLRPACELELPADARTASVDGQRLKLPRPNPTRVVVLGDTGCRIKGKDIQDCMDESKWPFKRVAHVATADAPDLIIHVGDFLYREDKCPTPGVCGAVVPGDNWNAWAADFFEPAAELLAAAPWAFSRGNHESCGRSWRGWFYYLDSRPWNAKACDDRYPPPYLIKLGRFELLMLDTSASSEEFSKRDLEKFSEQLRSVHATNAWLVDHHPFWGIRIGLKGEPESTNKSLAQAWEQVSPKGIKLIVSGHIHLFELLSYDHGYPPQLVAGDGSTKLAAAVPQNLEHTPVPGGAIVDGASLYDFGYSLMTRSSKGWTLHLKNPERRVLLTCQIAGNASHCVSEAPRGATNGHE